MPPAAAVMSSEPDTSMAKDDTIYKHGAVQHIEGPNAHLAQQEAYKQNVNAK